MARDTHQAAREACLWLPEAEEFLSHGSPNFRVRGKTFAIARHAGTRLTLCFWVGVDRQGLLTADTRFEIPPYLGHNGWIALDVTKDGDWMEIQELALQSYRHFALKRMLQELGS